MRKVGVAVLLIFVVYTIVSTPDKAADIIHGAFDGTSHAFHTVGGFFGRIFK